MKRFNLAWEEAEKRDAVAQVTRNGVYLEFASSAEHQLPLKNLESRTEGVRLLNARTVGEGKEARSLATVYVPKIKSAYFISKFRAYRDEVTPTRQEPKNQRLVASVDDIKIAFVRSFWTDDLLLLPGLSKTFVEVWLSTDDSNAIERFRSELIQLNIQEHPRKALLKFPERSVLLVLANESDLAQIILFSDCLAEFRASREPSNYFVELDNADQATWVMDLQERTVLSDESKVSVCILDTGVNAGHPLITPLLNGEDLHAVDKTWGTHDHRGHGTGMAGIAAYGDLHEALASNEAIHVDHRLESVKIVPPTGQNAAELWGDVTAQGIYLAEIQNSSRRRVISLAIAAEETRGEGKPTSWSAAVDQLAANGGEDGRLIVVCAGNISDSSEWLRYPDSNQTYSILDPGQAWNALTVGAYTTRILITSPGWEDYYAIAPSGGLSPFSATSLTWKRQSVKWPIKPEVLFEGGNAAKGPNDSIVDIDDLEPISTHHKITDAHFRPFHMTSAATACAANFAARIWSQYPNIWPETVRALIIHSADWTDSMKGMFLTGTGKSAYQDLLRTCGYGVPNISRATECLSNQLTLVAEASIQPFERKTGGDVGAVGMHFYDLPWPKEALLELGNEAVEMKVTLSYFIEPGPGEIGWKDRYRYASCGLRFKLNTPSETKEELIKRVNRKEEGDESDSGPSDSLHWTLGPKLRDVGSIHSDIWKGTASELASSNLLAVYPTTGWWKERNHLEKWNKQVRYALVVSIRTPQTLTNVDIYLPVMAILTSVEALIEN